MVHHLHCKGEGVEEEGEEGRRKKRGKRKRGMRNRRGKRKRKRRRRERRRQKGRSWLVASVCNYSASILLAHTDGILGFANPS